MMYYVPFEDEPQWFEWRIFDDIKRARGCPHGGWCLLQHTALNLGTHIGRGDWDHSGVWRLFEG